MVLKLYSTFTRNLHFSQLERGNTQGQVFRENSKIQSHRDKNTVPMQSQETKEQYYRLSKIFPQ